MSPIRKNLNETYITKPPISKLYHFLITGIRSYKVAAISNNQLSSRFLKGTFFAFTHHHLGLTYTRKFYYTELNRVIPMKTSVARLTQTFNNPLAPSLFQCNNFSHNSFLASKGKDTAIELLSILN